MRGHMAQKIPTVAEVFSSMEYPPSVENPKIAIAWLESYKRRFDLFINGEFVAAQSSKRFISRNPATGETLAEIAHANAADVDAAVKAARAAQAEWEAMGGYVRAKYLRAIARSMQKQSHLFALLEVLDNGKPIREAQEGDVPLAIRHFHHHAGWAQLLDSEFLGYEACGVVGQIIPWNFPLLMLAWKIAPALAAGNTVVLKPAEDTSLTALLFAEICQQAGLPKGVVNIVTGDGKTGAAIVAHKDIDKIAFTGSTEVGRLIRKATAGSGKALTLELGGKSPFIVCDDADIDSAIEGVVDSIWYNQGETCCAGSRLLLQEGIAEVFLQKLKARMEKLQLGDPLDKNTDMGAIINPIQHASILRMIEAGVKEGGEIHQPSRPFPATGAYIPPTLFSNVYPTSSLAQEEIFGPVLVAMTFRTADEAVELANNSRYGLAASIWSENLNQALDIVLKLKCGAVWVNSTNLFDAACGFGGYKESGYGREGGKEGMYAYLKPRFLRSLPAYTETLPVPNGTSTDIAKAVETAHKAAGWARVPQHKKAQILYNMADTLSDRAQEFSARIASLTRCQHEAATKEVETAIRRLSVYAAWADKFDGAIHAAPSRSIVFAAHEPVGVIGILCPDENPLLGLISLIAPAIAMGNTVVVSPSARYPLVVADFHALLDASGLPNGVCTIVTDNTATLAEHDNIDAVWYFGSDALGSKLAEEKSIGNLKRTFCNDGKQRDWFNTAQAEGQEFLRHATQVKNVWVPYGEVTGLSGSY